MNGASILAEVLTRAGVTHAFGTPGESTLPWYAAARDSSITHVMARCERCAGYMADVFGRLSNTVAVCDAPGGIGSPHLLPALHESHNSSTPLVVITSATSESKRGTWATSECEHTDMFRPTVKAVLEARDPQRLVEFAARSVALATAGRPGPVHLDIGTDVLEADSSTTVAPGSIRTSADVPAHRPRPSREQLASAADLMVRSERPLFVAGGGSHLSDANEQIRLLAESIGVPCATTFNGKGSIPETSPNAIGVVGAKGSLEANALAEQSDLIVWLGSKGGDKSTNYRRFPAAHAKSIQVDIDASELSNLLNPTLAIQSDVREFVTDLRKHLESDGWQCPEAWRAHVAANATDWPVLSSSTEEMRVADVIAWLNTNTPEETVVVADASRSCSWVGGLYRTRRGGRSVIAPRGSGSIGYALPGAIAACIARPDDLVIGVGGDGGLALSVHEMETARRLGVGPIFLLLNDGAFGLLNEVASVTMKETSLLGEFSETDWPMIANGFGWDSFVARTTGEVIASLEKAIGNSRAGIPTLIDARITKAQQSPDVALFRSRHGN